MVNALQIHAVAQQHSAWREELIARGYPADEIPELLESVTQLDTLVDNINEKRLAALAMVEAIKQRQADIAERRARFEAAADHYKRLMTAALIAAGEKRLLLPEFTVSLRPGSTSVQIDDDKNLPESFRQIIQTIKPDKAAIKQALQAGDYVPGCTLITGEETVTVRAK